MEADKIVDQLNASVIYVIALTLLVGIYNAKKYWKTPSGYILIYLGILLLVEYLGAILKNNHWLYNIQSFSELLTITGIFYFTVKERVSRLIVLSLIGFCLLFMVYELLFIAESFRSYLSYTFGLVSFAIPLMCFVYLFELTKSEKILNQNRVLLYWMCIGLMVYHLCNLPTTILINDLFELDYYAVLYSIQALSSITMYVCFIIGFIWSYRAYNI